MSPPLPASRAAVPNPTEQAWRAWGPAQQIAYLNSFRAPLITDRLTPRAVFESSIDGNPPFNEIMRMFESGGVGEKELDITFAVWLQRRNAMNAYTRFFKPVYLAYMLHYEPALVRARLIHGDLAGHRARAHNAAEERFLEDWAVSHPEKGLRAYAQTLRPRRSNYRSKEAENESTM